MIVARAPGKLFVAGEYAVLHPGEPAVLVAVDRYLTVELEPAAHEGRVVSTAAGHAPLVWRRAPSGRGIVRDVAVFDHVLAALDIVEQLRAELGIPPRYCDLTVGSELQDAGGTKYGLGSSAAIAVATIAALDEFYDLGLTRTERFRLALLAVTEVSPEASGGDLAASSFGGWIRYTAPDRAALRAHRAVHGVASALRSTAWERCSIRRLPTPDQHTLLVGWTGMPASTARFVDVAGGGDRIGGDRSFILASRGATDALADAIAADDPAALDAIREGRRILRELGAATGIRIETPELADLCDAAERHGAAAKPSGAGGGDCGVALTGRDADRGGILRAWEDHGIRPLRLAVHPAEGSIDAD